MRTLKLTDEQISLIIQALGIAEHKFTSLHQDIINNTIRVRGFTNDADQLKQAKVYFDKGCKMADLNHDICNDII